MCEASQYLSLLFLLNWNLGNQSHVDFGLMELSDLKLWRVNSLKEPELSSHLCLGTNDSRGFTDYFLLQNFILRALRIFVFFLSFFFF